MEKELGYQQDEFDGPTTLGEMLAGRCEHLSMVAARNLDLAELPGWLYKRQIIILSDVTIGEPMGRSLRKQRVRYENIRHVRRSTAEEVKECFGENVLADVARKPQWGDDLHAERERSA